MVLQGRVDDADAGRQAAFGRAEPRDGPGLLCAVFVLCRCWGQCGTSRLCGSECLSGCLRAHPPGTSSGRQAAGRNGLDQLAVVGGGRHAHRVCKKRDDAGATGIRRNGDGDRNDDTLPSPSLEAGASSRALRAGRTHQAAMATGPCFPCLRTH